MCKAMSHDIEIGPVRLLSKSGGRRNFKRRVETRRGTNGRAARKRPA
jgi:hypothetical protein